MHQIPDALTPLAAYAQFILYKLVPHKRTPGKFDKIPFNPHTGASFLKGENWQQDPSKWTGADAACGMAQLMGDEYGVGYLFTDNDPFWFLDIDECLVDEAWSHVATNLMACLPGCAVEVSTSGRGLHLFGRGSVPAHACKNTILNCEFYHTSRFVALTGKNTVGSAALDFTAHLPPVIDYYFPPKERGTVEGWTTEPVEYYSSTESDEELLVRALSSNGVKGLFDTGVTFADLYTANADKLGAKWPSDKDDPYDGSSADMSLAQHLAFWTGGDCERVKSIMEGSSLVRDKWDRDGYLEDTIEKACNLQTTFYSVRGPVATPEGACALRGSVDQVSYAESIRAQKLAGATPEQFEILHGESSASLWIDTRDKTAEEIVEAITPMEEAEEMFVEEAVMMHGERYMPAGMQREYFGGCIYINDQKAIFTPTGDMMDKEQFNNMMGGYSFEMGLKGAKDTRKPWEAFIDSQVIRHPRVQSTLFRPLDPPGKIQTINGRKYLNTYLPMTTPRKSGDPAPFLAHLAKVLPDARDQQILLSYMAACVQHIGHKFQWCPLLQGTDGNGKTLFSRVVSYAVGKHYSHWPPAGEISEKFNDWLFDKLFIGIEDIHVTDAKREIIETLKPMISNDELAKRAMQRGQQMHDVYANFILNSNHRNPVHKNRRDRRFCIFFTAQQTPEDKARDGMTREYMTELYNWLKGEGKYEGEGRDHGYAIVNGYLQEFAIPAEFNPALGAGGLATEAPITSTTEEALREALGGIEQEILEQVDQGVAGFCGGFISSVALDTLLVEKRKDLSIPRNRRRELLQSLGYDYHPGLKDGKATRATDIDNGKRPRLFVKRDHPASQAKGRLIVDAYVKAQQAEAREEAERLFSC